MGRDKKPPLPESINRSRKTKKRRIKLRSFHDSAVQAMYNPVEREKSRHKKPPPWKKKPKVEKEKIAKDLTDNRANVKHKVVEDKRSADRRSNEQDGRQPPERDDYYAKRDKPQSQKPLSRYFSKHRGVDPPARNDRRYRRDPSTKSLADYKAKLKDITRTSKFQPRSVSEKSRYAKFERRDPPRRRDREPDGYYNRRQYRDVSRGRSRYPETHYRREASRYRHNYRDNIKSFPRRRSKYRRSRSYVPEYDYGRRERHRYASKSPADKRIYDHVAPDHRYDNRYERRNYSKTQSDHVLSPYAHKQDLAKKNEHQYRRSGARSRQRSRTPSRLPSRAPWQRRYSSSIDYHRRRRSRDRRYYDHVRSGTTVGPQYKKFEKPSGKFSSNGNFYDPGGLIEDNKKEKVKMEESAKGSDKDKRKEDITPVVFADAMGKESILVKCPSCSKITKTMVYKHQTSFGWALGSLLCICGGLGYFIFRSDSFKNFAHFCGHCKSFIGEFSGTAHNY